jgi:uncharacterized protein (UPF0248 family)
MAPILQLLSRIRWDKEFGSGCFEVGYLDHVKEKLIRIPFRQLHFQEGNRFSFQFEDQSGETLSVPFHRIKEVYRDGIRIWKRSDSI